MTEREALKLALEAFEWNYNTDLDNIPACEQWAKMLKANITAIREALAQPEQEPVAWDNCRGETQCRIWCGNSACVSHWNYITLPHRKPLTDEEIDKLPWEPHEGNPMTFAEGLRYFARAIEAAHGIKGEA